MDSRVEEAKRYLQERRCQETREEVAILENQAAASADTRMRYLWLKFAVDEQERLLKKQNEIIAGLRAYLKEHNISEE